MSKVELTITIFSILICPLSLIRPRWGFYLLLFTIPWMELVSSKSLLIPGLNLATLSYVVCWLGSLTVKRQRHGRCPLAFAMLLQFLVIFGSWLYLSTIGNPPLGYNSLGILFEIKRRFLYMVIFFITLNLSQSEEEISKNLKIMALSVFFLSVQVGRQFLMVGTEERLGYVLGPNNAGTFFSTYYVIFLIFFLARRHFSRGEKGFQYPGWLPIIPLVFTIAALVFSQSRGAWLAFGLSVTAFIFFKSRKLFIPYVALILLLSQGSYYKYMLPNVVIERIEFTVNGAKEGEKYEGSAQARVFLYETAIKMFSENPIAGKGFATFPLLVVDYSDGIIDVSRGSHSEWLRSLAETGLIGFVTFSLFFVIALTQGFKLINISRRFEENRFAESLAMGFLACTVSLAINNIFGTRFFNSTINAYFWVIAAHTYAFIWILESAQAKNLSSEKLIIGKTLEPVSAGN